VRCPDESFGFFQPFSILGSVVTKELAEAKFAAAFASLVTHLREETERRTRTGALSLILRSVGSNNHPDFVCQAKLSSPNQYGCFLTRIWGMASSSSLPSGAHPLVSEDSRQIRKAIAFDVSKRADPDRIGFAANRRR
jgi:hypothetical protein